MKLSTSIQILVLLAMLTACSANDDSDDARLPLADTELSDVGISFSGLIGDEQVTRAASSLESTGVTTFRVWSYKNTAVDPLNENNYTAHQKVMDTYTVNWVEDTQYTTTSNTDGWEYVGQGTSPQYIKFWDWSAKAYRFFGVTGTQGDGSNQWTSTVDDVNKVNKIEINLDLSTDENINNAPYVSDLWFSTGNPVSYPDKQFGQPVRLSFHKPYARVRYIFIFADGLSFGRGRLYEPHFYPQSGSKIATAGSVTFSYPFEGTGTAATSTSVNDSESGFTSFDIDYYETPVPAVVPADAAPTTWPNTPEKWYAVMPARNQGPFVVSVKVNSPEVKTAVVPAEYMNWTAGYEYTYRFKITESGGVHLEIIQVAINDWVNEHDVEHMVYNW